MRTTDTTRWALAIAPLGFLGGWLLLAVIDGDRVPGPWWTTAHAVWLAGAIGFVLVGAGLRPAVRPSGAGAVACVVVVVASALNAVGMVVDLVLGALASSPQELSALLDAVADVPGLAPLIYDVVPNLAFPALASVTVLLARRRWVPWWTAGAVVAGVALLAVALVVGRGHPVTGIGMSVLAAGMIGIAATGWRDGDPAGATPTTPRLASGHRPPDGVLDRP